jgi:predicted GIY-YIG superfamily endonuclease
VSRRAPSGPPARRQGWVYTLHFDPAYPADAPPGAQQAKHYTGFATDLEARLAEHAGGHGARLTQVQLAAGGFWRLANAEPGTADREAQLKERGATRRCPVCITERAMKLIAQWKAEREMEAGV